MAEKSKTHSKAQVIVKLLSRPKGATLADMEEVTGWNPHSVRAFLSGLRKQGRQITRQKRAAGESAWHIAKA